MGSFVRFCVSFRFRFGSIFVLIDDVLVGEGEFFGGSGAKAGCYFFFWI